MGKRKKKSQGGNAQAKQAALMPQPDNVPNWYDTHEVMMSVVMEHLPERFAEDWFCVICPVAKRRTVVANKGWTCSYNKLLALDRKFQSVLPGGNVKFLQLVRNQDMCILDCLHYKAERTFYVLDLMHWKVMPYYDTEAEFRFNWINMKLAEIDGGSIGLQNEYKFKSMPRIPCTKESLYAALADTKFKIDGLLFFHKGGTYICGTTPNVLWLEAKNMESLLGFQLPSNLTLAKEKEPAGQTAAPSAAAAGSSA